MELKIKYFSTANSTIA